MTLYMYPGSFAPLHFGHLSIAQYVEEKYKEQVVFEICTIPYDKAPLEEAEVKKRSMQFEMLGRIFVLSTNTSFVQKATDVRLKYTNPNEVKYFIVGYDTIKRIDDIKYYFGSKVEKTRCLSLIADKQWKFIVFPRNGKIDEELSQQIKDMCVFERDYVGPDISSTQIRDCSVIPQKTYINLGDIEFGKCFILDGNKYKALKGSVLLHQVKVFNGIEFMVMDYRRKTIEPVDEDFYPYMDMWGNNKK